MRQYAASPIIQKLIEDRRAYFDDAWMDQFYSVLWNVDTAQGLGLDIWGRIVGVDRLLIIPVGTPNPGGFSFTPGVNSLTDDQYRRVILAKALVNITDGTPKSINGLLSALFEDKGICYVMDFNDMSIEYRFEFYIEPYEYVMLKSTEVSLRPAGVLVNIFQIDPETTFGFAESIQLQPFDQGVFYVGQ